MELVDGSIACPGDKSSPYSRPRSQLQWVRIMPPCVEVFEDRYAIRIRRPNREVEAVMLVLLAYARPVCPTAGGDVQR